MGFLAVLYTGMTSGASALRLGVLIGVGVLLGAAVITQLFVGIIWLVSKVPAFGLVSLRMAFRSMRSQKRRLGSTLLALCIGMLAVGSVAVVAQNLKSSVANALTHQVHVKAIVLVPHDPAVARRLDAEVARLPGITSASYGAVAEGTQLLTVDDRNATALLEQAARKGKLSRDTVDMIAGDIRGIEGRSLAQGHYPLAMKHGRNLDKQDVGTNHMVIDDQLAAAVGAKVGSHLVWNDGARNVTFVVVGTYDSQSLGSFTVMAQTEADYTFMRHAGLTTADGSHRTALFLDIRDDVTQSDLISIRRDVRGALVLDLGRFLSNMTKAVDKLALFPEVIAGLALFAGVIIIANTVALAMLERRREIGVIKAVGARRRTILQFLLVENAVVGFVGAGAGVLLAMLATVLVDQTFLKISPSFELPTILGLLALGMALAMGASAVTALPASSEKPMTVLRYE
jgi:predicted lysophospholipase L1 biosynthesis ABC-type transport system permease subunit